MKGRGKLSISVDIRNAVWEKYGGRCLKCGTMDGLEYHHWTPMSKGGLNTAENIVLLCRKCHRGLHYSQHTTEIDKSKLIGRKTLVTYDEALPIFKAFYNEQIGEGEAKEKLGYSKKSHISDMALYKRFLSESGLPRKKNHVDLRRGIAERTERYHATLH